MDTIKSLRGQITERQFTTPLWQAMNKEIETAKSKRRALNKKQGLTKEDGLTELKRAELDLMKSWLKKTDIELMGIDPEFKVKEVPMSRRLRSGPVDSEPIPMSRRLRSGPVDSEPQPKPKIEYIGRRARAAAEAAKVEEIQEDEQEPEPEVEEIQEVEEPEPEPVAEEPEPEPVAEEPEPQGCTRNPLGGECATCPRLRECYEATLKMRVQIPHWVVDDYLGILSRHATKILIYLARKANFAEDNKHFGRAWASHSDIEKATGVPVSNMSRYLNELEGHGLITRTTSRHTYQGKVVSVNQFTVTWFKVMKDLRTKAKSKP